MKLGISKYGLGFCVSVYRRWGSDKNWTDLPTYRHMGMHLYRGVLRGPWFRLGFHNTGRETYLYLGLIVLWQSLFQTGGRWTTIELKRLGPIEWCSR